MWDVQNNDQRKTRQGLSEQSTYGTLTLRAAQRNGNPTFIHISDDNKYLTLDTEAEPCNVTRSLRCMHLIHVG